MIPCLLAVIVNGTYQSNSPFELLPVLNDFFGISNFPPGGYASVMLLHYY